MADDDLKFTLNLDNKDFLKKLLESKESIASLGEAKNLEGLTEGLLAVGAVVGALGISLLALKVSMDSVFDAENIKSINAQFEMLSKNAGVSSDALKEGLEKASGGLVSTNELLAAANKAMVQLGAESGQIPQIMELARKATSVFGGDLVSNFEQMNQAVATGNTRLLRHLGIKLDVQKAYENFAKANNIYVDELSADAKKQAVLNALLEQGNKQFAGINPNIKEATNLWQQMKVALIEIKEIVVIAFDHLIGPTVINGLKALNGWLTQIRESLNLLTMSHEEMTKQVDKDIGLRGSETKAEKPNIDLVDEEKRNARIKQAREDLQKSLDEINKEDIEIHQNTSTTIEGAESEHQQKIELITKEYEDKKRQIREEYAAANITDQEKISDTINEIESNKYTKIREQEAQLNNFRLAALQRYQTQAHTVAQGVGAAFANESARNRADLTNWGKTGTTVFNAFRTNSKQALLEFGAGHKSAGEAMKMFMFGAIADTAEAKGEELMLASLWPPNPVGIAAGGGLIALAGMLRSQAGGGSAGFGGVGAGGAGAGGQPASTPAVVQPTAPPVATPQKNVQVIVNGHIFDSDATATRIMELARQANDAQDFRLVQVGQS